MSVCINLIPLDLVIARRISHRRRMWVIACVVAAAAGGIATAVVRTSLRDPIGLVDELEKARNKADQAAVTLDDARASLREAQQKLQAVGGLADRPDWSILLKLIARCRTGAPQGIEVSATPAWGPLTLAIARGEMETTVIDSVSVKKAPLAAPPPGSPAGTPGVDTGVFFVSVRGRGDNQRNITALALRLENSGVFTSVRQGRVQQTRYEDRELLEFEFTCELGPVNQAGGAR
ncbi:MAG: hypothetical protein AMXMBFR58_31080 [Phycisphaerae bacterium]